MISFGFAGFRHGHIYMLYNLVKENSGTIVAGAWEEDIPSKKDASENHGVAFTHKTYEELIHDDNIDVVAVGNYFGARGKMVIEALKAGKHVITDKPLCTSLEELDEIERLSKGKSLKVGIMLDMRYHENVLAAKEAIEKGEIGTIHSICFGGQHPLMYASRPSWYFEEGKHGGVIDDIAIHGIDMIKFLTGLELKKIIGARCWNAYATEEKHFKDSGQMLLELNNGAGVIADVSYAIPDTFGYTHPLYWNFQLWGSDGMMVFSANSQGVELYKNGDDKAIHLCPKKAETDYLADYVRELNSMEPELLSSAEALCSTRQTLEIQSKSV